MTTINSRLIALTDQLGEDVNKIITKTGKLSDLQTVNNTTLVAAINECINKTEIDDAAVGITTTWSSAKIQQSVEANIHTAVTNILGGMPPETLDTIKELATAITESGDVVQTILNVLSTKVSFTEVQSLTSEQKSIARTNIGAASQEDVAAFQSATNATLTAVNTSVSQISNSITTLNTRVDSADAAAALAFQTATTAAAAAAAAKAAADASVEYTNAAIETERMSRIAEDQELELATDQKVTALRTEILTEYIGDDVDLLARYLAKRGPFLD